MNPMLFTCLNKRSPLDMFAALLLFVGMLAPVWTIASFVVDGSTAPSTEVASRGFDSPGEQSPR